MANGRVPGPLGFSDSSGTLLNTRRPLGVAGTSAAALLSPSREVVHISTKAGVIAATPKAVIVSPSPPRASKILGPSGARGSAERTLEEFKQAVIAGQIHFLEGKGRHKFDDLDGSELSTVEGRHRMRTDAAAKCRDLLAKARKDLEAAKAAKEPMAIRTTTIGIQSAYRTYAEDGQAWRDTFAEFYEESRARRDAARGGPHGNAAVSLFVAEMIGRKAPPGWSNHSDGRAVDLNTTFDGFLCKAKKIHRALWRSTWLHPWLVANAATFQFYPLDTEEWHWDYH